MQSIQVSFMMSGPTFEISIPDGISPEPIGESPLMLPKGGRSCVFTPVSVGRPEYTTDEHDPAYRIEGEEYEIWVTRRHAEPEHWFLDWYLPTGTLQTHVRDEDGAEMVSIVAQYLEIEIGDSALPTLLPNAPLGRAASRVPGYGEIVAFSDSLSSPQRTIELIRPGSSRRSIRETGNVKHLGTRAGIDIRGTDVDHEAMVSIRDELEQQVNLLAGG